MRSARRYEALAQVALGHGYPDVTGPGVQGWVKAGLLPSSEVAHTGYQQRQITEPAETAELLLEVCRRRYGQPRQRDLARLGLGMWLDGFPVPDRGIRRGLHRAIDLPGWLLGATRVAEADVYDLVNRAVIEKGSGAGLVASAADLATGVAEALERMRGNLDPAQMSADGVAALERAVGAPGLYQRIVAAGELPVQLRDVLGRLTVNELAGAIDNAAGDELVGARQLALAVRAWFRAQVYGDRSTKGERWFELAAEGYETDIGLGQLVVALLATPDGAAALRKAMEIPSK